MNYEQILYEVRGHVALITMNRPERLNAWTYDMLAEQADAVRRADADANVGAIVMTGAGRGFCSGADISDTLQVRVRQQEKGESYPPGNRPNWLKIVAEAKPLIAAVNGPAVGLGCTLILPFDYILASDAASFTMNFVAIGVVPELAGSHFLTERVGRARAADLCLTARRVGAMEAKAIGLVEDVAPADDLMNRALALGETISSYPMQAVRATKELLIANQYETDAREITRREMVHFDACAKSPEHQAALTAFKNRKTNATVS